jgi:carbohydrate-selective porin OprB
MAPPGASEVSRYVGGGIVRQGPIPSRPDDAAGAGITRAALFEGGRETVLEVFYQLQLHGGAFVQPDLQWIDSSRHPRSRAIAAGVRFGLEF